MSDTAPKTTFITCPNRTTILVLQFGSGVLKLQYPSASDQVSARRQIGQAAKTFVVPTVKLLQAIEQAMTEAYEAGWNTETTQPNRREDAI